MSTSSGGGFCDCGDVEAWSNSAYCSIHLNGSQSKGSVDTLSKVSDEFKQRTKYVFVSVLKYAYELLTTETMLKVPPDLTFKVNA